LDTYPHVFFTTDTEWHPQNVNDKYYVTDLDITDDDLQHSDHHPGSLDAYGDLIPSARKHDIHLRTVQPNQPDLDTISPNFGVVPCLRIQHTLYHTTQFARLDTRLTLCKHLKAASQLPTSVTLIKLSLPTAIFRTLQSSMMASWDMVEQRRLNFSVAVPAFSLLSTPCGMRTILPVP
jgi:hypothetical protein